MAEILHRASLAPKKTPCKNSAQLHRKNAIFKTCQKCDFRAFMYLPRIFGQNWKLQNPQFFCFDFDFLCPKSSLVADFDLFMWIWKHFLTTWNLAHKVDPNPEAEFQDEHRKTEKWFCRFWPTKSAKMTFSKKDLHPH